MTRAPSTTTVAYLRSLTHHRLRIGLAFVCFLFPANATAQDESSEADPTPPVATPSANSGESGTDGLKVTPPQIISTESPLFVRSEADAPGGLVVLRLTISTEGVVLDAAVEQGLAANLDEQIRSAALAFQFTPATKGSEPISVTILFPYEVAPSEKPQEHEETEISVDEALTTDAEPGPEPSAPEQQVTVQGWNQASELRRSAYAVEVIDLTKNHHEAGDLGDVMARSNAVTVRRSGGLGSLARFSMGGMGGERVRFFVDGVPLKFAGFPYGPAYVPVNLVDRVEMYQGVVPIKFGTDALGGVVAFVTDQSTRESKAQLSYELGSFNTHRLGASGQVAFPSSKSFVRASAHLDSSDNDYPVDVLVPDPQGRLVPKTLRRFHDAYQSYGITLSGGISERKWADRLIATAFASGFAKEIQNDATMTVPYGEIEFGKQALGGNLRWLSTFNEQLNLETTAGYSYVRTHFKDVASCRYSWTGDCLIDLSPIRGEIAQVPVDKSINDHALFARAQLSWTPHHAHAIRFAIAPDFAVRTGDDAERSADEYDPLNDAQSVFSTILGTEWEANALADRLTNILFAKFYAQSAQGKQEIATAEVEELVQDNLRFGAGDSLRYFLSQSLYLKGSYELATRLPDADEYFGDGGLIVRNLELTPEQSHNLNVGLFIDDTETLLGTFHGSISALGRFSEDLILLLSSGTYLQYDNITEARGLGTELQLTWTSPADIAAISFNGNYLDLRNQTSEGQLSAFQGDRIPNQPYLRGATQLRLRARAITHADDFADLTFRSYYVHEFYQSWESAGNPKDKLSIPSQFTHDIGLSYVSTGNGRKLSGSLEAHNITNANVYDFYGVQRPGRSFHFKFSFDI